MKLNLEIYGSLCSTKEFVINGIEADIDDFGEKYDREEEDQESDGCGDMQFTRISPTESVLKKYNITEKEYEEICTLLEEGLSFGSCGYCE